MCYSSHAPKVLHLHDPGPDPCRASWNWGASPKYVSASKNQKTASATSVILQVSLLKRYHKTIIQVDRQFYDAYLIIILGFSWFLLLFLLFLLSFTYCLLVHGSVLFHPSQSEPWLLDWHSSRPCPREQTLGGCRTSAIWCVKKETQKICTKMDDWKAVSQTVALFLQEATSMIFFPAYWFIIMYNIYV